jgi:hypothetical protein
MLYRHVFKVDQCDLARHDAVIAAVSAHAALTASTCETDQIDGYARALDGAFGYYKSLHEFDERTTLEYIGTVDECDRGSFVLLTDDFALATHLKVRFGGNIQSGAAVRRPIYQPEAHGGLSDDLFSMWVIWNPLVQALGDRLEHPVRIWLKASS